TRLTKRKHTNSSQPQTASLRTARGQSLKPGSSPKGRPHGLTFLCGPFAAKISVLELRTSAPESKMAGLRAVRHPPELPDNYRRVHGYCPSSKKRNLPLLGSSLWIHWSRIHCQTRGWQ